MAEVSAKSAFVVARAVAAGVNPERARRARGFAQLESVWRAYDSTRGACGVQGALNSLKLQWARGSMLAVRRPSGGVQLMAVDGRAALRERRVASKRLRAAKGFEGRCLYIMGACRLR